MEQKPNSSEMMAILRILASNSPIRHISPGIWGFFNIKGALSPVKRVKLRLNIALPGVKIL